VDLARRRDRGVLGVGVFGIQARVVGALTHGFLVALACPFQQRLVQSAGCGGRMSTNGTQAETTVKKSSQQGHARARAGKEEHTGRHPHRERALQGSNRRSSTTGRTAHGRGMRQRQSRAGVRLPPRARLRLWRVVSRTMFRQNVSILGGISAVMRRLKNRDIGEGGGQRAPVVKPGRSLKPDESRSAPLLPHFDPR